jgi:superoxide reductase
MHSVNDPMGRRAFLNATGASTLLLVSTPACQGAVAKAPSTQATEAPSSVAVSRAPSSAQSKLFVCDMCGHVEFGAAPEFCPVCHTEERFAQKDSIFSDALGNLKDGGAKHTPVIRVQRKSTLVSDVSCSEVRIRVGEIMHEMDASNHIHFVDFYLDEGFFTRFFASPQLQPAVVLFVRGTASRIRAVSFCNMHGFWQAEALL